MATAFEVPDHVKSELTAYINTAFATRYAAFNEARQALLSQPGDGNGKDAPQPAKAAPSSLEKLLEGKE